MSKNPADTIEAPDLSRAASAVWDACVNYIRAEGVKPNVDTLTWHRGDFVYTSNELAQRVWRGMSSFPVGLFTVTLSEMIERFRAQEIERIRTRLLVDHVPNGAATELERFVALIAHPSTDAERMRYYVLAFRQLIWQVKRRLRSRRTYWEVMPVLVGPQGTGKSSAVEKLAAPLGILYMADADFSLFADAFRISALNRAYLIRFDEMGHARKADLERVKQRITAPTVQARAMRSEQERRLERNASFIGTSNHSILKDLQDATGMRRFCEIKCLETRYTDTWGDKLRGIDYTLLWQCETGLDETAPLASEPDLVARFQSELRTVSTFECFCDSELESTGERGDITSNREAYERYVQLISLQNERPMTIQIFAREMTERYGEPIRPKNALHWRGLKLTQQ